MKSLLQYNIELRGVTHHWKSAKDCGFPELMDLTKKEAYTAVEKAVKAGRNPEAIRVTMRVRP